MPSKPPQPETKPENKQQSPRRPFNRLLLWLLENEPFERALVFTNTRDMATHLSGVMRYRDQAAGYLHGEVKQDIRTKTIRAFREGMQEGQEDNSKKDTDGEAKSE